MTRQRRAFTASLLLLLWLIPAAIFLSSLHFGWVSTWSALGVPSYNPPFLDLRVITSGLLTKQAGGDPFVANPYDPLGRNYNYPRIWLVLFSLLHINDRNVAWFGLLLCAAFLACVSTMILRSHRALDSFIIWVSALSVSSLYAFERGNIDLLIFALLYVGCVTASKSLRSALFALAAVLKVYPFAAAIVDLVLKPLRQKLIPFLSTLLIIFVLALQFSDLRAIARNTPVSSYLSYGALSIREFITIYARYNPSYAARAPQLGLLAVVLVYLSALVTAAIAFLKPGPLPALLLKHRHSSELFLVFGAIYVFSFAIGSNWDYRLIFLTATLPFALACARDRGCKRPAILYIAFVLFSQNLFRILAPYAFPYAFILIHLVSFAVFLMVLAVLSQAFKQSVSQSRTR